MRQVSLDVLGIALDVPFAPPQSRKKADLDGFAAWLCDHENGLGLRADQVRLKSWDDLFGYELVAQFFGDNGILLRSADRIRLEVKNARSAADWEIVRKLIVRFYTHMNFSSLSRTTFSAHVHSRVASPEDLDAYFEQHPMPQISSRPALFSYVKIIDWESDVRVLVEKSNAFPEGGLFIGWETHFMNNQDWDSFIGTLPTVMENSAHFFGLGLMRGSS